MPISLVSAASVGSFSDVMTTAAIDTTGATFLVASFTGSNRTPTVSDSKGNTWTGPLTRREGAGYWSMLYYCTNPTVGGGHTFTSTASAHYGTLCAAALSGVATTSPYNTESNGGSGSLTTSVNSGSVTTADNGALVISVVNNFSTSVHPTINLGFAVAVSGLAQVSGGNDWHGGALAYLEKVTAGACSPTWSSSASALSTCVMADFDPTFVAPSFVPNPHPRNFAPLLAQ